MSVAGNSTTTATTAGVDDIDEWIEVQKLENMYNDYKVKIDLMKRTIEFSVTRPSNEQQQFEFRDATDYATFRFKDLDGYIDLCTCDYTRYDPHLSSSPRSPQRSTYASSVGQQPRSHYSLIFTLKYPPRLYSNKPAFGWGYSSIGELSTESSRDLVFGGIPAATFGSYHGIKIDLSFDNVEFLLLNKGLRRLQTFGIIRPKLMTIHDVRPVQGIIITEHLPSLETMVSQSMKELHQLDPCLGTFYLFANQFSLSETLSCTLAATYPNDCLKISCFTLLIAPLLSLSEKRIRLPIVTRSR